MMKFYKCKVCGKIIAMVRETSADTYCCGQAMEELTPKMKDNEFGEKHVPVIVKNKNKITIFVGDLPHPMESNHYIEWIAISTNKGNQRKCIDRQDEAKATFYIGDDEELLAVYAYCNLHGLWKKEI